MAATGFEGLLGTGIDLSDSIGPLDLVGQILNVADPGNGRLPAAIGLLDEVDRIDGVLDGTIEQNRVLGAALEVGGDGDAVAGRL